MSYFFLSLTLWKPWSLWKPTRHPICVEKVRSGSRGAAVFAQRFLFPEEIGSSRSICWTRLSGSLKTTSYTKSGRSEKDFENYLPKLKDGPDPAEKVSHHHWTQRLAKHALSQSSWVLGYREMGLFPLDYLVQAKRAGKKGAISKYLTHEGAPRDILTKLFSSGILDPTFDLNHPAPELNETYARDDGREWRG